MNRFLMIPMILMSSLFASGALKRRASVEQYNSYFTAPQWRTMTAPGGFFPAGGGL